MSQVKNFSAALVVSCLLPLGLAACGGGDSEAPTATPSTDPASAGEPVSDPLEREIQGADPADQIDAGDAPAEGPHEHGDDHSHDGDDHSHDHDHDHDMAGGEAHTHGDGEAAIVLEGRNLTVTLNTALASLGASEAEPETDDAIAARAALRAQLITPMGMVDPVGEAGCIFAGSDVAFRYSGDHGHTEVSYDFQCSSPDALEGVSFDVFGAFDTLETVEVAVLVGDSQSAVDLTPANPVAMIAR